MLSIFNNQCIKLNKIGIEFRITKIGKVEKRKLKYIIELFFKLFDHDYEIIMLTFPWCYGKK